MGMAKDTEQANAMKEFMARPPNEAPEKKNLAQLVESPLSFIQLTFLFSPWERDCNDLPKLALKA